MSPRENSSELGHFSMIIEWSEDDDAYVVTVPELPGCVTHGLTHAEAVRQGEDAIATWLEMARASGDPIPAPRVFAQRSTSRR